MGEFLSNISTIYWWVSVVVVGILLNVFSAYIRDALDWIFSRLSKWWSVRTETKRAERQKQLKLLFNDKEAQDEMIREEFRDRLNAIKIFIFSIMCILIGCYIDFRLQQQYSLSLMIASYSFFIFSLILLFTDFSLWSKAVDQDLMVYEVKQKEKPTVIIPGQKQTNIYPIK
ncbi:MAG TPA: hypothetical protein VGB02_10455 [Pyrinomonadaceae bacterium]|jgi:hypothetical protein